MTELRRSPLHDRHVALGAKFAPSAAGRCRWSTPAAGCSRSTRRCGRRSACSTCPTWARRRCGAGAAEFVNACLTNDLDRIGPGQAQYTLCCDASGGVVDDLIAYLHADDHVLPHPERGQHRRGGAPAAAAAPRPG